jgi:hypothetical protein
MQMVSGLGEIMNAAQDDSRLERFQEQSPPAPFLGGMAMRVETLSVSVTHKFALFPLHDRSGWGLCRLKNVAGNLPYPIENSI